MNARSNTPQRTLLAIDDAELIHRLLRARLASEPILIECARTGREGLELARRIRPDIILLDIILPDLSGFDVLQQLQSDPDLHQTPVIFISSLNDTSVKVRCFDMGATDFLSKPFDVAELRARIRSALRVRGLIDLLAQRAKVDGHSRLWNRAYFDQRLAEETAAAIRRHSSLSVVMADLDHFKSINDTYGHPFGDRVIDEFARLLERGRSIDVACRYGGEEFVLILPDTSAREAAVVAERCRHEIEGILWPEQDGVVVTSSFGVADLASVESPNADALVAAADAALYAAKRAGRNRVEVFQTIAKPDELRLTA